jgi:hypothetical protein
VDELPGEGVDDEVHDGFWPGEDDARKDQDGKDAMGKDADGAHGTQT